MNLSKLMTDALQRAIVRKRSIKQLIAMYDYSVVRCKRSKGYRAPAFWSGMVVRLQTFNDPYLRKTYE